MKQRAYTPPGRPGFSIIELLVVVAIIGGLVGLTAVAIVPWIGGQQGRNTKALLKKLDGEVVQHWGEAVKQFRTTPIPPAIAQVFGGNEATQRAIWIKLQLKAAFPMSYAEALDPTGGNPALKDAVKPRTIFVTTLGARKAASDPQTESAACLLIALKQNFGGKKFDADTILGPGAMKDTDGDGIPEIVDGWGKAVLFCRWGTGNPDLDALSRGARGAYDRDTEDSEHALMNTVWNPDSQATPPAQVAEFQRLCHQVRFGSNRQSYFTIPTIVSAGKDGQFGLNFYYLNVVDATQAEDNLYSFKVR